MNAVVDLNADVGEGFGADAELFALVTSANVACGWHAGDVRSMTETVRAATAAGVRVGAHPSFPDRAGFGRVAMARTPEQVYADVYEQVGALEAIAREQGSRLHHVKPHGALYTMAARDERIAAAVASAVRDCDPSLVLVGLAGSVSLRAARAAGLRAVAEVFADRAYTGEGELVARSQPGAVLDDERAVVRQVLAMACDGCVESVDGRRVALDVQTICLHGDSPHALAFARAIRAALENSGVEVRAFA